MDKKLTDIYHGIIMDHNNNPVHFEKAETCDHDLNAYNALCGDHFHIYLDIEDGVVRTARFHGYGCAISKASTSILVKNLQGKPVSQLAELIDEFKKVFAEEETEVSDPEFQAFRPVLQFPSRVKCATLSWEELEKLVAELE